jgi:hypothetical protein
VDRFQPIFWVNWGLPPLCPIVTGKTYPDRKLFLFGKKLQLRFKLLGVEMQGPTREDFSRGGNSQSKQKARGNEGFHRAPFCFGANLRTALEQYNLG